MRLSGKPRPASVSPAGGAAAGDAALLSAHSAPAPVRTPQNADAPVRVDAAMPRALYDRLTDRDEAPRSRYDAATGRAEFVAEPSVSHEWRAVHLTTLLARIAAALDDTDRPFHYLSTGASRLLSGDGAFEPDASFFIGPGRAAAAMQSGGYLDAGRRDPIPDIVAEIDRSTASRGKLAPYFRMGVREAWTWSRGEGARIWVAAADAPDGFRAADASSVLPGLRRDGLDLLLASRSPAEADRHARQLAAGVTAAILAR